MRSSYFDFRGFKTKVNPLQDKGDILKQNLQRALLFCPCFQQRYRVESCIRRDIPWQMQRNVLYTKPSSFTNDIIFGLAVEHNRNTHWVPRNYSSNLNDYLAESSRVPCYCHTYLFHTSPNTLCRRVHIPQFCSHIQLLNLEFHLNNIQ
jgi:hypothetical protein